MKCEECGVELTEENTYRRAMHGVEHHFCCSHCAGSYQKGKA
ncbi:MAG: transcriptional regulator [Nitrososphaerota archaeon]|nr:transcriptional regulator [Nitrososphaerota archaeon]MDG7010790.1 transcriptional regulator [Nitrososphaerota archaeon]